MMKIDLIAGARPNFMKIAPIIRAIDQLENSHLSYRLVHTGQHYDQNMSGVFFDQLNIPMPDVNLKAGSGSQATQTAAIMVGYEQLLSSESCDLCVVVGDVNSTMACAIVAKKMGIKVAHVEGGLRSFDWSMPEEINRVVTDSIADYFFTTSRVAKVNLRINGINEDNIFFVGNTMIDTLLLNQPRFIQPETWRAHGLAAKQYLLLTLHRPANVDDSQHLHEILTEIVNNSMGKAILFPVHPRTRSKINGQKGTYPNMIIIDPLPYLEFNYLVQHSLAVITDSGGITEETTVMGVPCLTLRESTERPETVSEGTNEIIGAAPGNLADALSRLFNGEWKEGKIPELWDGKAGERIVQHLLKLAAND